MESGTNPQLAATPIVRRRLAQPEPPALYVPRPRLKALLGRLTEDASVVAVTATAGSGKTTAVAEFTAGTPRPVAWLTCDESDSATGRLLTYLEATVHVAVPGATEVAREAMETGLPHSEVAGLLAEAIAATGLILVLDETERWADSDAAWTLLASLVRYFDRRTCVVLVGRREPPAEQLQVPLDRLRVLGDLQLALTLDEATQALHAYAATDVDPHAAVESTGGWMTGVLFEAWCAEEHIDGMGGESDPLNGYLSSHILGRLDRDDREFLVTTSVFDEVTARRASALGVRDPGRHLQSLRRARVPCTWSEDGTGLRCHTRFRQYLKQLLERRGPEALRDVRRGQARLLEAEGHDEDAVEQYLAAGESDLAALPAERSILGVLERGDFDLAARWLEQLGDTAPLGASPLTVAELMLAIGREDFRQAERIVDQLEDIGALDEFAGASQHATALVAWAYLHMARVDDFVALMRRTQEGAVREAMQYVARVVFDQRGPTLDPPPLSGSVFDAFVLVGRYCLGRVSDIAAAPLRGWTDGVASPWLLAAIRDTGQTQRAVELYDAAMAEAPSGVLAAYVGPELLMDAGLPERARVCVEDGIRTADESGSLGLQGLSLLSRVRLALRVDHDPLAAEGILDVMQERGVHRFAYIAEAMHAWRGLARLQQGDVEAARRELELAVSSMIRGDRVLDLPAAAVWLAEASWQAGDEDAADRAADTALAAADKQRSDHLLVQALRLFPTVLSRRLDAEADPDSRWFEVARAFRSGDVRPRRPGGSRLHVKEFGSRGLEFDGEAYQTGIAKAHEVLAALAALGRQDISRAELMDMVFDARTDRSSRTYMRQALSRLKQALPEGAIEISEEHVRTAAEVRLTSDSQELLRQLSEASSLRGAERLAALDDALEHWTLGAYLPGVRGEWAELRERELQARVTDAADDAATLALAAGDYHGAERHAKQALADDPYRESTWRTLMRLHHALGDEPGLISVYTECRHHLADIGVEPSGSTQRLLTSLRR